MMVAAARRQQPRPQSSPAQLEILVGAVFFIFLGPALAQQAGGEGATAAASHCARIFQEGDCGPAYAELCPAECGGAAPGGGEPHPAGGEGGQQLPLTWSCDEVASRHNCGVHMVARIFGGP